MKQNDYFLNLMYNPDFSPGDFETVGLKSDNTTIRDKEEYKNLDIVKNNPVFLTDGEFDENKFNLMYNKAMFGFLQMSQKGSNERLASSYSAFRDDIFAKSGTKDNKPHTYITKIANPNKLTIGFVSSNIMEAPTKSVREAAEAEMVWNGEKWIDAPNDDTIGSFFDPKVLALWDFDADINGNPTKDTDKIVYRKGEKKINPITGTYYYETLNGRSIYGREVLSGWDTLTVDGSTLNKYDFFDSDDLEKSTGGSLLKAAVKVAPALIPTISPWYILARVGLSMADLSGKVMKMTTGSDNSIASWLEGVNASFTQSTSDYARGSQERGSEAHAWGLENMLNLGADVFTQLAELRWMFKYGSSFLGGNGKLGFDKKAQETFKAKKLLELLLKIGRGELIAEDETAVDLFAATAAEALSMLDNKLNSATKLGEYLSKLYMTGITVADSYGEAKEAGLSDTEAALFTLAYGLGEYDILNTNLGEHILPELRAEKRRMQAALTKLSGVELETKKDTRKWYKRILSDAKDAVAGDYNDAKVAAAYKANSPTKAFTLSMASNALGEGLEEVSEELWFDIAKSLLNAAVNIGLSSTGNKMEAFDGGDLEKVASRYALNFVGGTIGGGIAVGLPGFQEGIKNMLGTDMTKLLAYLEIVALVRNGKKDELYKTIDKLEIADENLAASKLGLGTKDDNLNLANKKLLKGTVDMIEKLLTVHGADVDDHSVLKGISEDARGLIRFQTLLGTLDREGSTILASYVQRFNNLATKMAGVAANIEALENKNGDKSAKLTTLEEQQLTNLRTELNLLLQLRDNYFNGEMAKIVMPKILFELSASLSTPYIATNFKDYVEKIEHRVMSDIPEERLKLLKQEWEDYKQGEYKDDFMQVYSYFDYINKRFSDKIKQFDENYFKNINDLANSIGGIFINTETQLYGDSRLTPEDIQQGATSYHKTGSIDLKNTAALRTVSALYELASLMSNSEYREELDILRNLPDTLEELKSGIMSRGVSDAEADNIIATNFLPYLQQASRDFLGKEFEESDLTKIRKRGIQELGFDLLTNAANSEELKRIFGNIRYINLSTKDFLVNDFFRGFMSFNGENEDIMDMYDEDDPELERLLMLQSEFSNIIKNKQVSPIDELADLFLLAIGDESKPLSLIIKDLDILAKLLANKNKIDSFSIEESVEKLINYARQILNLLKTHVLAARKDGAKLGNLYGFNYVMNSLDPDVLLAEIDKEIADNILYDIAKTESRLIHYLNLFNINSGLKLAELKKIKTRTDFNFIKKAKYIISILPDDWKGKEKLEAVTTDVYNEISKKSDDSRYDISLELRNALLKESILLLDAIYDFFKENEGKDIYEIINKLKLLPSTSEVSTTYNGTTINNQLNDFDDRTFLYMLATAAAVRASDFYELMKTSIDPRYAPIPGLELAIKMAFAFLTNLPLFEAFGRAYNLKILEETSSLSPEAGRYFFDNYNKIISNDSKLDSSYALLFMHTFLVEGGPGTGKSSGYYSTLVNMLKKFNPNLLKNVWVVHTNKEKAELLGKEIGLDNVLGFSREEYLKKIFPEYKPPVYNKGVIVELRENLVKDPDTEINYWKDVEIARDLDNPTLIIFDESTRFSQQEMLVSEKFQKEMGIHGIATGDYDLIGAVGQLENSDGTITYLNTFSDNFIHSPKLGSSMRTENKIKDLNINNFRESKHKFIKELRANGAVLDKVDLKYYLDANGLYGEKVETKDSDTLDATIGLMLDSLQDGEQINYIADDKESELYKKLLNLNENDDRYKGKIRFVDSGSAQGEEAQYYIVELSLLDIGKLTPENQGVHDNFINTFYTAISRSKQGTLIIKNRNIDTVSTNTRVDELIKSPLSGLAIVDYGNEFVQSLSEITGDPKNILYNPIGKTRKKLETPKTDKNDDIENPDKLAKKLNTRKYPIKNDNPKEYNMLMHSMPVSETGFEKGADRKYRRGNEKAYAHRIDGLNGLTKLGDLTNKKNTFGLNSDGTLKNLTEALARLNSITQAGLYMDNKEDIRKHIIDLLGLIIPEDEIGIDFMYMIKSTDPDYVDRKGIFNRMFKSIKEKLMGIFVRGEQTDEATLNKYLAMNVYRVVKDSFGKEIRKNFLTVPLSIFTSPLTMMETEGFKELKDIFVNLASRDMLTMISLLLNNEDIKKLPNAEKLLKSLLIYTYKSSNGDIVVYLDDFIPARDALAISGPSITVSDSKGYTYHFTDKYQYDGEYVALKDIDLSVHHISKDVYFATEDVLNENDEIVIPKGHRFVLVSDIDRFTNDRDMLDSFVKNELGSKPQGRISVIYVSAPKVSISDYFLNFALQYRRKGDNDDVRIDTSIGIETTDFRLSEFITQLNSPFDLYIKLLVLNDSNKTAMLARWEVFKNIISQISLDAKSSEDLMNILKSSIAESKYLELIKAPDGSELNIKDIIDRTRHTYLNNKGISIKNFISNLLLNFIIKNNKGFPDTIQWTASGELQLTDFIKDNIAKLEECLNDTWKEGIFIRLQPKNESYQINVGENTFVPIKATNYEAETDNVKVGNRNIRINGKIDTTVHVMEVGGLMDTILDTINNVQSGKNNYQLDWYVKDSRPHKKEAPKKGIEVSTTILNKYKGENLLAIVNANESEFKDLDLNSEKDLIKTLNKVGYAIVTNDDMTRNIVKIPKNSQQFDGTNIVKTPDEQFNIIIGDNLLKLTAETLQLELERYYLSNIQNIVNSFETWELNDRLDIVVGDSTLLKEAVEFIKSLKEGDKSLEGLDNILLIIREKIPLYLDRINLNINEPYDIDSFVETVKYYILHKKEDAPNSNIYSIMEITPLTDTEISGGLSELAKILQDIEKLADKYEDNNSCVL